MKLPIHLNLIIICLIAKIAASDEQDDNSFEKYCDNIEHKITIHQLNIPKAPNLYHEQLTHLTEQFDQEFNEQKIKHYEWQKNHDHTLKKEIDLEKQMITVDIFSQLYSFKQDQKTPLNKLIDKRHALYLKEAFLNALLNRWASDHETIKEKYDQKYGKGSFFNKFGNYRTNPKLSASHKFATTLWKKENNQIIAQIPNETLSIYQLRKMQIICTQKTDHQWHIIEQELQK